mmetsp:Transcript_12303/g.45821  ORF Transcript_12303/g.45821 Transcript_12303/m.45821 type:complete len:333 (+) Transcript_12303:1436-2434(+)
MVSTFSQEALSFFPQPLPYPPLSFPRRLPYATARPRRVAVSVLRHHRLNFCPPASYASRLTSCPLASYASRLTVCPLASYACLPTARTTRRLSPPRPSRLAAFAQTSHPGKVGFRPALLPLPSVLVPETRYWRRYSLWANSLARSFRSATQARRAPRVALYLFLTPPRDCPTQPPVTKTESQHTPPPRPSWRRRNRGLAPRCRRRNRRRRWKRRLRRFLFLFLWFHPIPFHVFHQDDQHLPRHGSRPRTPRNALAARLPAGARKSADLFLFFCRRRNPTPTPTRTTPSFWRSHPTNHPPTRTPRVRNPSCSHPEAARPAAPGCARRTRRGAG